jgi:hypothetical protein
MKGTLGSVPNLLLCGFGSRKCGRRQKYLQAAHECRFCLFPGFRKKLHFGGYYVVLVDMRDLLEFL